MVAVVTPRRAAASSFESRILALFPRTLEHVALLRGYLIQHLWFLLFSGGKRPKCLLRLLINAVSLNWNLSGLVCSLETVCMVRCAWAVPEGMLSASRAGAGLQPAALVPLAVARCLVSSLVNGAATVKLQPAGRVGGGPDRPDLSSCKRMILRLVLSRSGGLSSRHPRLCAFDTSFPALYNDLDVAGLVNHPAASESLTDVSATCGPC